MKNRKSTLFVSLFLGVGLVLAVILWQFQPGDIPGEAAPVNQSSAEAAFLGEVKASQSKGKADARELEKLEASEQPEAKSGRVPSKSTQSGKLEVGGKKLTASITDYATPLKVARGEKLPSALVPWATPLGESLPAMAVSYETWKQSVTPELEAQIAPTESEFTALSAKGYLGNDAEYLYHLEVDDGSGTRMLYVVGREEAVEGAGQANFIKLFKWNDGRWLAHAEDDLALLGKMSLTRRDRLREALRQSVQK